MVNNLTMLAAALAIILALVSAMLGGPSAAQVAYVPSTLFGFSMAITSGFLSYRAWKSTPPVHLVAWVFGHLCIWATAFGAEEAGWALWRHFKNTAGLNIKALEFFEFSLSPFLKIIQGCALSGLVAFAVFSWRGVGGEQLTLRIRIVWVIVALVSSIMLLSTRFIF